MLQGTRKYWLIALVFGLLVAALFYRYLHDMKTAYTPGDLVTVVKARENIARDTIINADALVLEEIPAQYVHPDAVRDKAAVLGKVATSNIAAGEQILNQKMLGASDEEKKRLAYTVPQNKRAMSVAVDSVSGVSGHVQRGDVVDVVAVVDVKTAGEAEQISYSILVVQNVVVLSIGQNASSDAEKKTQNTTTVTLAVSVEEAQRLALATEKGAIRLLLRSPVDKGTAASPPIGPQEFVR